MTHVLLVDHSQTGTVGGALTGLIHLIRGLDRERYRSTLVLYEEKNLGTMLDGAPCRVVVLDAAAIHRPAPGGGLGRNRTGRRAQHAATLGALRRLFRQKIPRALMLLPVLRRERPDVIHAGNSLLQNIDVALAARWAGIPCVVHEKGLLHYTPVERLCTRSVAACICMTEAIRRNLRASACASRAPWWCTTGSTSKGSGRAVRRGRARGARRRRLRPLIGITANVNPWKGQDVVVRAVAELVADFSAPRLSRRRRLVRGAEDYCRVCRRSSPRAASRGTCGSSGPAWTSRTSSARSTCSSTLDPARALRPGAHRGHGAREAHRRDGRRRRSRDRHGRPRPASSCRRATSGRWWRRSAAAGDAALRARFGAAGERRARSHFSLASYVPEWKRSTMRCWVRVPARTAARVIRTWRCALPG